MLPPQPDGSAGSLGLVRANQGHSTSAVESDALLTELTLADVARFPTVCHGTTLAAWPNIQQSGLSRMTRRHVHFAPRAPGQGQVISGMRSSSSCIIYLDLARAMAAGLRFYLAQNEVILTEGDAEGFVRPDFFLRIVDVKAGVELPTAPAAAASQPVLANP